MVRTRQLGIDGGHGPDVSGDAEVRLDALPAGAAEASRAAGIPEEIE
jgi:hypothetical protein